MPAGAFCGGCGISGTTPPSAGSASISSLLEHARRLISPHSPHRLWSSAPGSGPDGIGCSQQTAGPRYHRTGRYNNSSGGGGLACVVALGRIFSSLAKQTLNRFIRKLQGNCQGQNSSYRTPQACYGGGTVKCDPLSLTCA